MSATVPPVCIVAAALLVAACLDEAVPASLDAPAPSTAADGIPAGHIVGIVVDPELVPISGATVSVAEGDVFTTTDATGTFDLGPLPAGKYAVVAEHRGYASAVFNATLVEGGGLRTTLTLHPVASDVPYHGTLPKKMYIICAFSIRAYVTDDVQGQTSAPCAGVVDLALQTATGQRYTNTLDNWTFDFRVENTGFMSLLMEMTWPEQQFGSNGLLQLSTLATASGGTGGVTVGGTVYGGAQAQPYRDIIHAGRSYWVSGGKNVTFYPEANATQAFQMLVAGYYGNTTVPLGGSALFVNFTPTVWLTFFYNRAGSMESTVLPDK